MLPILSVIQSELSRRHKKQLGIVTLFVAMSAFSEALSIGAIFPVIVALVSPDAFYESALITGITHQLNLSDRPSIVNTIIIFFVILIFLATILRITSIYLCSKVSFAIGKDISTAAFSRLLTQPYLSHHEIHSSEIVAGLGTKINTVIQALIFPFIMLISAFIQFTVITIMLLIISPTATIFIASILLAVYLTVTSVFKERLLVNSKNISQHQNKQIKIIQECLANLRDIIIGNSHKYFEEIYNTNEEKLRKRQAQNVVAAQAPRFLIESIAITAIMICILLYVRQNNYVLSTTALATIGLLVLAAQRILPIAQQAYRSWANIMGNLNALSDIKYLLNDKGVDLTDNVSNNLFTDQIITFEQQISLDNIYFQYPGKNTPALRGLNLNILKGQKIGIIGETGAGKSTLVDTVLGLIFPQSGTLKIDGRTVSSVNIKSWQRNISHVPQHINLVDADFYQNIAFGIDEKMIDKDRVHRCAKLAKVDKFALNQPKGYSTTLGEQGTTLSGGQRQRIGIARSLYKNNNLIVLDEATNALDHDTEFEVMQNIVSANPKTTMIIISHRMQSLTACDQIVEMRKGEIVTARPQTVFSKEAIK